MCGYSFISTAPPFLNVFCAYEQKTNYSFYHNFRTKHPMSVAHIIFIAPEINVFDCVLNQWL
jgi:hypothetical protein